MILLKINIVYANSGINVVAESAILVDQKTERVIFEKNSTQKMYPASTTKILTAILAVENLDMDKLYVIGSEIDTVPPDSSKAGHKKGESILAINLVRGLLIPSGNESACSIALQVSKKLTGNDKITYEDAEKYFVELMNKKAKDIGAKNSNFMNPHGYHDENHYTTAYDLYLISAEAMKNETIKTIVAEIFFKGNGAGDKNSPELITNEYDRSNNNFLISSKLYNYPGTTGIKTGSTKEAGECLIASAEKDGKSLISVVLKSDNPGRWNDSKTLFDHGFNNYNYIIFTQISEPIMQNVIVDNPKLGDLENINIYPETDFLGFYTDKEKANIIKNIKLDNNKYLTTEDDVQKLKTPIIKNERLGLLTYTLNGEEIFSTNLISSVNVDERTFGTDLDFVLNVAKENAFTTKAIPFWIGLVIIIVLIIALIISSKRKRRDRNKVFKLNK